MGQKNRKKWVLPCTIVAVVVVIIAILGNKIYQLAFGGNVTLKMGDVIAAVKACKTQLIIGGTILGLGIIVLIYSIFIKDTIKRKMISAQGCIAIILSFVMTITWVCLGVEYSNVNSIFTKKQIVSTEHKQTSEEIAEKIAEEGITLLKNEDHSLPLTDTTKINVFGWSSVQPVYAGTGSGSTSEENCVSLLQGLEDAGFEVNTELENFYNNFSSERPTIGMSAEDFTVPEPTIEQYEDAGIFESAKSFSDTAIVVVARSGGEGGDLPMSLSSENNYQLSQQGEQIVFSTQEDDLDATKSYLELTNRERAMLNQVTKDYSKVIVIVNSSATMELGWLNEYESIKAALWCPGPGEKGFEALGKIIKGEVNPSGHLVDTYVYDLLNTPTVNNFGSFAYTNYEDVTGGEEFKSVFVNYVEGIYVGYRFYETAGAEGLIDYDSVVQFPFGYGQSYTSFDANIANVADDGTGITLDVLVTNTGDVAGKYVAEIYYNPPYTNGGIEKATANLVEFAKTDTIEPGQSQKVSVQFAYEDMASYDSDHIKSKNGAYVLEAGDYQINLCSDAHTIIDTYVATVDSDIIYDDENAGGRSSDGTSATNQFDYAKGDVTYLSRKDNFANYEEAIEAPSNFTMSKEAKETYVSRTTFDASRYDDINVEMPTTEVKNGIKIQDMTGVSYDDEKWDKLLDQLSVSELQALVADAGYHTVAIDSINLPYLNDADGPAGISSMFTGASGTAFPVAVMIAATWNEGLAYERGQQVGLEATDMDISGWYGPAMDTHRSAFSGRNFEYYSEDGLLSGKIAANEVKGAQENGLTAYIKHFALNDSETDRTKGICTWSTEQAIREIYLKPFEIAVKEGESRGVMNSFNAIGTKWAGANEELLVNVLRKEWGFVGCVMTDAMDSLCYYYEDPNAAVRSGTDKMLAFTVDSNFWNDQSAGTVTALRNAAHNYLYALANSNAMDINSGIPTWVIILVLSDVLILAILLLWEVMTIKKYGKKEIVTVAEVESEE